MNQSIIFKRILYFFVFVSLFIHGCNQDDSVTPSDELPFTYKLPQGEEAFNDQIVEFRDSTGTFVIYDYGRFDPLWNVQSLIGKYSIVRPQKEYIEAGINAIFGLWLGLYPYSFMEGKLPRYVYLADSVFASETEHTSIYRKDYFTSDISMVIAGTNVDRLDTSDDTTTYKVTLNQCFWEYLFAHGKFEVPEALNNIDYGKLNTSDEAYEQGIIHSNYRNMTIEKDFTSTFEYLIKTKQSSLTSKFKYNNYMTEKSKRQKKAQRERMRLYDRELKRLGIDIEYVTNRYILPLHEED